MSAAPGNRYDAPQPAESLLFDSQCGGVDRIQAQPASAATSNRIVSASFDRYESPIRHFGPLPA